MKTSTTVQTLPQTMIGFFKKEDGNLALKEDIQNILNKKGIHSDKSIVSHFVLVDNQDLMRIKKLLPAEYSLVDDECTEIKYSDIEKLCPEDEDCE